MKNTQGQYPFRSDDGGTPTYPGLDGAEWVVKTS